MSARCVHQHLLQPAISIAGDAQVLLQPAIADTPVLLCIFPDNPLPLWMLFIAVDRHTELPIGRSLTEHGFDHLL